MLPWPSRYSWGGTGRGHQQLFSPWCLGTYPLSCEGHAPHHETFQAAVLKSPTWWQCCYKRRNRAPRITHLHICGDGQWNPTGCRPHKCGARGVQQSLSWWRPSAFTNWKGLSGTFAQQGFLFAMQIKRHPIKQSFCLWCWRDAARRLHILAPWHFMVGSISCSSCFGMVHSALCQNSKDACWPEKFGDPYLLEQWEGS